MHSDAPPSYDSMFGELAQKKAQSDGVVDFTKEAAGVMNKKASGICGLIVCGIFCSILGAALPITEIVIGALYLKECPAQRLLPIYLIVSGVFSLISGSSSSWNRYVSRDTDDNDDSDGGDSKAKAGGCCGSLVGMFVFIWFICGNAWVFRMTECENPSNYINSTDANCFTKNTSYSSESFYCRELLYDFVFYETIAKWALFAFVFVILILACCCCCCVFCCSAMKGSEEIQNSAANNPTYSVSHVEI